MSLLLVRDTARIVQRFYFCVAQGAGEWVSRRHLLTVYAHMVVF